MQIIFASFRGIQMSPLHILVTQPCLLRFSSYLICRQSVKAPEEAHPLGRECMDQTKQILLIKKNGLNGMHP